MVKGLVLPWLESSLSQALQVQRGHALLVHGPQGVGQFEFGLAMARAWLCEAPQDQRSQSGACGHCTSCHLIDSHTHPDLLVLVPEALSERLGWSQGDAEDESRDAKRKPSKDIKVDAVRRAVAFAQTTTARGAAKVVMLYPADRLNTIAANTLLKTLEEPPGAARFVLSTGRPQALLPTIRSRCQAVALTPPPRALARSWLREQGVSDPDDILLDACGGQVLRVSDLIGDGVTAAAWRRLPASARQGDVSAVATWPLPVLIDALQKLCHDLLCQASAAPPRYFPQAELSACQGADVDALHRWAETLTRLARQAEHPWSAPLMIESLLTQAQRAMRTAAGPRPALHSRP